MYILYLKIYIYKNIHIYIYISKYYSMYFIRILTMDVSSMNIDTLKFNGAMYIICSRGFYKTLS